MHALLRLRLLVGETRAQHHGPSESSEAASNVDGSRTCKVVEAELVQPAARVPLPVGQAARFVVSIFACLPGIEDGAYM